jgi:two-component system, chemotaxis family, protein-glutamate methylesterase/glutaminase
MAESCGIVVVGASRGGIDAVCKLARSLPAVLPSARAIVLHTAPESPRMLASIIGACTHLPVSYAGQNTQMLAGHIYIAPPSFHLIVASQTQLELDAGPKVNYSRPAADRLFESAAQAFGTRTIGVVLSGGNVDGTQGLRAIKAAGGIAIVQNPVQALDPGMPQSALQGDHPDYCLNVEEIGPLLARLVGAFGHLQNS